MTTTIRRRLSQPVGGAPGWAIGVLGTAAVVLVPWSIALTTKLPAHHIARHWDIAWAGFDAGLALMLLATVVAAVRESPWLASLALAAAALLLCDAWFDVITAAGGPDLGPALAAAVIVELPLATTCALVARSVLPSQRHSTANEERP